VTEDHKLQRKNTSSQHLEQYRNEEEDFLLSIVTGDEVGFTTLNWKPNVRAWNGVFPLHRGKRG
jgi:hypothetical protein